MLGDNDNHTVLLNPAFENRREWKKAHNKIGNTSFFMETPCLKFQ